MNKLLVILLIGLLFLVPNNVEAATTADVVITARGIVVGSPSGLAISYTGEDYVDITWAKGIGANNTMVRVGIYGYPTSLTDGDLVYYGNGTYAQYFIDYENVLLNEEYDGLYFKAWSESFGGAWELIGVATGASNFWKDVNLMFLIISLAVLVFTIFAFRLKNVGLSIISAFGWSGLAIYQLNAYYSYASISGIEPIIGYSCALMCICMFISPIMFMRKPKMDIAIVNDGVFDDLINDPDLSNIRTMRNMTVRIKKHKKVNNNHIKVNRNYRRFRI